MQRNLRKILGLGDRLNLSISKAHRRDAEDAKVLLCALCASAVNSNRLLNTADLTVVRRVAIAFDVSIEELMEVLEE